MASIFSQDPVVNDKIVNYLMLMPIGYAGMGIVLCANSALNALQKTGVSMMLNLVRLTAFYVPLAWIGGQYYGFEGLLFGASMGNILAGLIVWSLIRRAQAKEAFHSLRCFHGERGTTSGCENEGVVAMSLARRVKNLFFIAINRSDSETLMISDFEIS